VKIVASSGFTGLKCQDDGRAEAPIDDHQATGSFLPASAGPKPYARRHAIEYDGRAPRGKSAPFLSEVTPSSGDVEPLEFAVDRLHGFLRHLPAECSHQAALMIRRMRGAGNGLGILVD